MKAHNVQPKTNIPRQCGLSLVELMISLTIGLLLLAGLSLLFVESSRSHRELSEASKQIENGRYAIQLLGDDLHLAGFYGRFTNLPATPAAVPDPCEVTSVTTLYDALPIHIQGYSAGSFTTRPVVSALCAAYLPAANLQPGSDVFVIRRADTSALASTVMPTNNEVYIQGNVLAAEIQKGVNGFAIGTDKKADGCQADGTGGCGSGKTILKKDGTAAEIRKYHVHVYFVAPCSMPAGGGNDCTGAADDGGKPIPTLKRLDITSVAGATAMSMVSLVDGIEMLKVDYGIDKISTPDDGTTVDGSPNNYVRPPRTLPMTADMTPADWANIMGVNIYILSRNPLVTASYTDTKTYAMGLAGNYAPGGNFKRHVYSTLVRLTNPAMRREQ